MTTSGNRSVNPTFEPRYYTVSDIEGKEIAEGVAIRIFSGKAMTMSHVTIAPHALVPTHTHPHEQLGLVLEGDLEFWINEDRRRLRSGDAYRIPPHCAARRKGRG